MRLVTFLTNTKISRIATWEKSDVFANRDVFSGNLPYINNHSVNSVDIIFQKQFFRKVFPDDIKKKRYFLRSPGSTYRWYDPLLSILIRNSRLINSKTYSRSGDIIDCFTYVVRVLGWSGSWGPLYTRSSASSIWWSALAAFGIPRDPSWPVLRSSPQDNVEELVGYWLRT